MAKITITIEHDDGSTQSADFECEGAVLRQVDVWNQQSHRKVPETGLPLYVSPAESLRAQAMEFLRSVLEEVPTAELVEARRKVHEERDKAVGRPNVLART